MERARAGRGPFLFVQLCQCANADCINCVSTRRRLLPVLKKSNFRDVGLLEIWVAPMKWKE
jgi:hypothetical protein